jgi:hypothetical protein
VRQAFLSGTDQTTGKDFFHGRDWVENRILALVDSVAVMTNQHHEMQRMESVTTQMNLKALLKQSFQFI